MKVFKKKDDYDDDNDDDQGNVSAPKSKNEANESGSTARNELEMSLCNHLINKEHSEQEKHEIFEENQINFESFDKDPYSVLFDQNLCFRIEDNIVDSKIAIPQVISLLAFNKDISKQGLGAIVNTNFGGLNDKSQNISKSPESKYIYDFYIKNVFSLFYLFF